jgi:hypothetical protein
LKYHVDVPFSEIEGRLERLVEGVFARFSKSAIQPAEIGKKLSRHIDMEKRIGVRGPIIPNDYLVVLSHEDFDELVDISNALKSELQTLIHQVAKERNYRFVGFPDIRISYDENLHRGSFAIESKFIEDSDYLGHVFIELPNGLRIPVGKSNITIGRAPSSTVIIDDPKVSRSHAEITPLGNGSVVIRDLGSTNGTKVNGKKITSLQIDDGDVVDIGTVEIKVGRQ